MRFCLVSFLLCQVACTVQRISLEEVCKAAHLYNDNDKRQFKRFSLMFHPDKSDKSDPERAAHYAEIFKLMGAYRDFLLDPQGSAVPDRSTCVSWPDPGLDYFSSFAPDDRYSYRTSQPAPVAAPQYVDDWLSHFPERVRPVVSEIRAKYGNIFRKMREEAETGLETILRNPPVLTPELDYDKAAKHVNDVATEIRTRTGYNTPRDILDELLEWNSDVSKYGVLAFVHTVIRFSYLNIGVLRRPLDKGTRAYAKEATDAMSDVDNALDAIDRIPEDLLGGMKGKVMEVLEANRKTMQELRDDVHTPVGRTSLRKGTSARGFYIAAGVAIIAILANAIFRKIRRSA